MQNISKWQLYRWSLQRSGIPRFPGLPLGPVLVDLHVGFQMVRLPKAARTYGAYVWFLTGVNLRVVEQLCASRESLPARFARVRALPRMCT